MIAYLTAIIVSLTSEYTSAWHKAYNSIEDLGGMTCVGVGYDSETLLTLVSRIWSYFN